MLMPALKMAAERTPVDCVEKERKQSIIWLNNVKYLHKSIATFSDMTELVLFFILQCIKDMDFQMQPSGMNTHQKK